MISEKIAELILTQSAAGIAFLIGLKQIWSDANKAIYMIVFWMLLSLKFSLGGLLLADYGLYIVDLLPVLGTIAPLIGPVLYLHVRNRANRHVPGSTTLPHFIPAILSIALFFPLHFFDAKKKLQIFTAIYHLDIHLIQGRSLEGPLSEPELIYASILSFFFIASNLVLIFYLILLMKNRYFMENGSPRLVFDFLSILGIIAGIIFIIEKFSFQSSFRFIPLAIAFIILSLAFLLEEKYTELKLFFQNPGEKKSLRSLLGTIDRDRLHDRIAFLMQNEKIYLLEDLTLPGLASHLGISPHQLSEFLNKNLNIGFKKYINQYRIREACEIMKKDRERNLLQVAFDCGFNSRTSFNRTFFQEMKKTPDEYRKTLMIQ